MRLEQVLHRRVVGQDEAVNLVTEAILRARNVTLLKRPDNVLAFFSKQLKKRVAPEVVGGRGPAPLRVPASGDDYGG